MYVLRTYEMLTSHSHRRRLFNFLAMQKALLLSKPLNNFPPCQGGILHPHPSLQIVPFHNPHVAIWFSSSRWYDC